MADSYEEDDSIAPEHAVGEIGKKISWAGRAIDAGMAASNSIIFGAGSLLDVNSWASWGREVVGESTFLDKLGITTSATPFLAGAVALGEGLQAVDDLANGDVKKAGKHTIVGAAKAGVVFLDGMTMGVGEIASLLFTGKMLSTNVGNVVGQLVDGVDKRTKTTSNVAAVGYPGMQMQAPMDTPQQITPDAAQNYYNVPQGGWQNYVLAGRGQAVPQPGMEAPAPIMSGQPRFANAIEAARANAAAQAQFAQPT